MDKRTALFLLLFTYFIKELWTLLPDDTRLISPFPFSDVEITLQTYVFFASIYCVWMVMFYVVKALFPEAKTIIEWFFWFQFLELIEFFLNYNEPWTKALGMPIGVTFFKIVVMSVIVFHKFYTWKRDGSAHA